jgi:endogenous inhibitor of DNA gyrase (YacG/DUF329 family)
MTDRDRLRLKLCPICGKPAVSKLNPFCSARCADVDLNRWFAGSYAIPADGDDDTEEADVTRGRNGDA